MSLNIFRENTIVNCSFPLPLQIYYDSDFDYLKLKSSMKKINNNPKEKTLIIIFLLLAQNKKQNIINTNEKQKMRNNIFLRPMTKWAELISISEKKLKNC